MSTAVQRRFPVGAELVAGGVHFRVWAPGRKQVEVVLEDSRAMSLENEGDGYFSGAVQFARPGVHYRFRLDGGELLVPDPASRFQSEGPHGPSQIVDPFLYRWKDEAWNGVQLERQVMYEMHIGTFTREGTWSAACELLPQVAEIGITLLEIMPVAEFPGKFGWGYDGTALFAPAHLYGTPDDFRAFVDRAHAIGLAVVLDVVYNHLGPDGNYLKQFSETYFTDRYANEWGEAINFDGQDCQPVRDFFVSNAAYWIEEFHLDGLRLDATQQIFDNSYRHILADINHAARRAAGRRSIVMIAENERQDPRIAQPPDQGGYGLDAIWNDDFHHSAQVAVTGRCEAYYTDYCGTPQELISAAKWGFLYQGQYSTWQRQKRGHAAFGLKSPSFVNYLQNHDQIANSAYGSRLHVLTSAGRLKAITALLLLMPGTPLLFQGQEFGASTPFLYFADHHKELARRVEEGRCKFLDQFPSIANSHTEFAMGVPHDRTTFEKCKLNHEERRAHAHFTALHRDLLKLRREDPVFSAQRSDWIHGAVLGPEAFGLRFFGRPHGDRLLILNLGRALQLRPVSEPLLAPPPGSAWRLLWSSEHPRYEEKCREGEFGNRPLNHPNLHFNWGDLEVCSRIPGHCALVMYEGSST